MLSIDQPKMTKRFKTLLFLLIIWLTATSFNITKAVYIDDISTINIGRYLLQDLKKPNQAILKNDRETGIASENSLTHPPLVPYLGSAVIFFFGENELIFHIVWSLFTLMAITFFYLLARHLTKQALLLTFLFIINPAFVPSQNLMLDLPLVVFTVMFFYFLLRPRDNISNYLIAGISAGLALLVKYTGLVLVPILTGFLFLGGKKRLLWIVLIPVGILLLWSAQNYLEFRGLHLISNSSTGFGSHVLEKSLLWIIVIGSVSPFSIFLIPSLLRKKSGILLFLSILLSAVFLVLRFLTGQNEEMVKWILRTLFLTNGLVVLIITLNSISEIFLRYLNEKKLYDLKLASIAFWFILMTIVLIFSVPFMAVRHVLTVIPALLLLIGATGKIHFDLKYGIIGIFVIIIHTLLLAIGDNSQADSYRKGAAAITRQIEHKYGFIKNKYRVWSGGFYGWRWYTVQEGLMAYNPQKDDLRSGDLLVLTSLYPVQINPLHQNNLILDFEMTVPRDKFSVVSTMTNWPHNAVGYYYLPTIRDLPYEILPQHPLEKISVYRFER
ncbi:MAG: hypothetical protein UV73_C0005G0059 [Candidatus Gottesmanbacteria bacterium GW2011_GWA2_43_14]|uniref:Glycosyltransferase RgtA/B/C/D-like domain-containing protein n=1 Tax=Candidatus Gottesmanbacteria bacterium GW2011_GWA2_43_14 TaxID=1618443 RepID=A0A0G1DJN4_9BACT|nr:MAG: hypothetical protein UV73_C0005G0059 [Candidatus Gottesmanbacteria bacterium GW2011_GWA2_43_14]